MDIEMSLKMQWSQYIAQLMPPIIQLWISITQVSISISDACECMITYAI